jgi:hypothetical protein
MAGILVPSASGISDYTTFTPTYAGITVGNGTNSGRYLRIGKLVHVLTDFTFGSTSSASGNLELILPFTAQSSIRTYIGSAYILDTGINSYTGLVAKVSTTNARLEVQTAGGTYTNNNAATNTVPFTWGTGDLFYTSYFYEVA